MIEQQSICTFLQPIVDLSFGEVVAYEALSRGPKEFGNTEQMFAWAESSKLLWELENVCHCAAIEKISGLSEKERQHRFFLNVSPQVFSDSRFRHTFPFSHLREFGLDQRQIVFEITEVNRITDYRLFEGLIHQHVEQGYQIALDDFGAGHSSLITLVAASPHYLKLDRAIVSGIHLDSYKQHLVKSIVSFASSVESKLIAEGVEEFAELEVLIRLGVTLAQGYLFGRPQPEPAPFPAELKDQVRRLTHRFYWPGVSLKNPIAGLVMRPPTIEAGSKTFKQVEALFHRQPSVDHLVVCRNGRPIGLVPKQHFYTLAGGPFGYSLFQNKYIEEAAKQNPLVVEESLDMAILGRIAMNREHEDVYDPVIVINADGDFVGTVTMKQLLTQTIRLEVQMAASSNPLTGLPGNLMIESWLQDAIATDDYYVIYADLDHFKEYNDTYGFPQGDQMIRLTAQVLMEYAAVAPQECNLGHVGGDDFVMISQGHVDEMLLSGICRDFDERKRDLFKMGDLENGCYHAVNRQGVRQAIPLVTLSLAVVSSVNLGEQPHTAQLGQVAAGLKKKIKDINHQSGRSGYLIERRKYS